MSLTAASSAVILTSVLLIFGSAAALTKAAVKPASLGLNAGAACVLELLGGLTVTEVAICSVAHLIFLPAFSPAAVKQFNVALSAVVGTELAIFDTAALNTA
jgi:hypothetical protein